MALHNHTETQLFNIPVKNEVKFLGVVISKDPKVREKINLIDNMIKSQNILNLWVQKDLSIFGTIVLLSRMIHPAFSSSISDRCIKNLNQMQYKFLWTNKHHYLRKSDIVKPINVGGLNVINFDVMNGSLKSEVASNLPLT